MKPLLKALAIVVGLFAVIAAAGIVYVMNTGLSARDQPGALETFAALRVRNLAVARRARDLRNAYERSPEIIAAGRAHFADHCAVCHANNGSGDTEFGRGLFPKPPDLRLARTQELTDGELFYIIEHGIRFTGMPAFGADDGSSAEGSWHLVHFIRHLPDLSDAELEAMVELNPAPPADIRRRLEEERFLRGEIEAPPPPAPDDGHGHKHD